MKFWTSKPTNRPLIIEVENTINEIGPDNIAAFVAETCLGGLVGDVPPPMDDEEEEEPEV